MSLLIGFAALLLGAAAAAWGYRRRSYHQVISGTPTSRVLDVDEQGTIELTGTVRPATPERDLLRSPLSEDECLVSGWEIEEWNESGKHSSWNRIAQGYDSVPFVLDDGSAEIRVELGVDATDGDFLGYGLTLGDLDHSVRVDDVTVDFERLQVQQQLAPSDDKPPEIERFEARMPAISDQSGAMIQALDFGTAHGERKYYESTIGSGDEVYLLGTVQPKDDGRSRPNRRLRPEDAVVTPAGDGPFILSSRSEDELLEKTRRGGYTIVGGLAIAAFGLGVLVIPGLL